jgi:hypothetical protein
MRIMGFSVFTLALIFIAFILGAKNPGVLDKFPFMKMSA